MFTSLVAPGCSKTADQPLLNEFFAASRLRDRTALQRVATVIFEPRTQGIITHFDITAVGREQRQPLTVKRAAQLTPDPEERGVVALSLDGLRQTVDLDHFAGDLVSKEVTISAAVILPGGQALQKMLVITMQRAIVKGNETISGRWILTRIRDGTAGANPNP